MTIALDVGLMQGQALDKHCQTYKTSCLMNRAGRAGSVADY